MLPPRPAFVFLLVFALSALGSVTTVASDSVDYLTEIKPLLREKCYSCHGALRQEADLRLETLDLMLDGSVVEPGESDDSELIRRVLDDGDQRMPPPDEGARLTPDQIRSLRRWIDQGAKAPKENAPAPPSEHWSFRPIPHVASFHETISNQHPVDALLEKQRKQAGVHTVKAAERSVLMRRLYLDLIGLPPTAAQLRDTRPLDQIVDELLASPAYGERWGRHWMDIWRYSDWYGLGAQIRYSQKHIWRWRDWIVRSLNEDKGYDRMVMEMIAGDELAPDDADSVAGTGYLARNYYLFNRTTWLDSTIEHTGKAFLGLTLNCAKCHDHKYDPISQVDYYRFRALLEPHQIRLDPVPGVTEFEKDGLPRAFDDSVERPTFLHIKGDPKNEDRDQPMAPGFPMILANFAPKIQPIPLPPNAYAPGTRGYVTHGLLEKQQAELEAAGNELFEARQSLKQFQSTPDVDSSEKVADFEIEDSFDRADESLWRLIGDHWEYRDGALHLNKATREPHRVQLVPDLPVDFEVDCLFTTTGGATYKSVTFRFDESADGNTANYVYTSAHEPGPKVQAAYTRDGTNTYPPSGRKATPVKVGQQYRLRFAVRRNLVNVWLDQQLMLAYEFPDRPSGSFSLSGFDATVAFDEIKIRSLPSHVEMARAGVGAKKEDLDPESAVIAAERKLAAATSSLEALRATVAADQAVYVEESSESERRRLAIKAAEAQLRAKIADAEYRIIAHASDSKKLKQARDQKQSFESSLKNLDASEPNYDPVRGSRKALESPAHKEADYGAVYPRVSTGRRLALAKWMTSRDNPLTARVAVNHVWMRHFGTPLVDSVFDFGLRAKEPVQVELLNYLAAELIESGWSFKRLHRLIVTSSTYQLDSSNRYANPDSVQADPENHFYWRANARRMESQLVRDTLLCLAQELELQQGGPSVDPGATVRRRSLYLKHSRDQQDKFLSMFDDADILQCYRRSESIVPQQALALSNSKLAIELSLSIASTISSLNPGADPEGFINEAFFTLLGRECTPDERKTCRRYIDQMNGLPELRSMPRSERESRIRARLVQVLINHNDFISIR